MRSTLCAAVVAALATAALAPTASAGSAAPARQAACSQAGAAIGRSAPELTRAAAAFRMLCREGAVAPGRALSGDAATLQQTVGIFVCQLSVPGVVTVVFAFVVPEPYLPVARAIVAFVDLSSPELTCVEVPAT